MVKGKEIMTEEEIKQLCNELDSIWNRYHSYAALARVMSGKDGIDYVSSGSSRKVYRVSDTKVLKLAKNAKGSAQNYTEADWSIPACRSPSCPAITPGRTNRL